MTDPRKKGVKKKRHTKRKGLFAIGILAVVLVLGFGVLGGLIWYKTGLDPAGASEEKIAVVVEEGETLDSLLAKLKEKGLIRSEAAAKVYSFFHRQPRYAGVFELTPAMGTPAIFNEVASPAKAHVSYAAVMIPEGTWAKDIARILAEALPQLNADELLRLWNDNAYIETLAQTYPFLDPAVLENDQYFVKLEGYLFPDTYHIDFNMNEDQVTRMFLDQFNVIYQQYKPEIEASGYTLQEILTLASVIQFESGIVSEMPDISGVLHNRLNTGMPLQSSVTVCYALYDRFTSPDQCETEYTIESPYNTYLHSGLPIGPILNPGQDAIAAALHPAANDYLFFVSDIHGDGKTYFARTYEEHLANMDRFHLTMSQ